MRFTVCSTKVGDLADDTVVCFATEIKKIRGPYFRSLNDATEGGLTRVVESEEFTAKEGEMASFSNLAGMATKRLLLVGLGKAKALNADCFRRAMGMLSRYRGFSQSREVALFFGDHGQAEFYQAAVEGYLLGAFKQREYKTGESAKDDSRLTAIRISTGKPAWAKRAERAIERGRIFAEGQLLVRRLSQTPAADLTPRKYARQAQQLARKYGFVCRVLDEKAIAKEKMGAFLGVAKGSEEPPRFLILQHDGGRKGQRPIVLVGKGVTFDSGGISLKPGLNMHEMKQDMTGSAIVLAAIAAAARLGLKQNLIGLVPATENMPSGHATRPGDILTARSGKTIEIINTDAEGRLILADALDYADKFKPQAVIDIATLTGASLYILGYSGAPIMGNNGKLLSRLCDAAEITSERVWRLPIWDDHREQMKSSIADLVNSGGRPAGTIAAGAFLEYFVGDWPWAHIDIAYVDAEPKGRPYTPKGATGFGLRLLVELLSSWKKL